MGRLTGFEVALGTVSGEMVKLSGSNVWFHVDSESNSQVVENSTDEET